MLRHRAADGLLAPHNMRMNVRLLEAGGFERTTILDALKN